jgi:hypothetical protein
VVTSRQGTHQFRSEGRQTGRQGARRQCLPRATPRHQRRGLGQRRADSSLTTAGIRRNPRHPTRFSLSMAKVAWYTRWLDPVGSCARLAVARSHALARSSPFPFEHPNLHRARRAGRGTRILGGGDRTVDVATARPSREASMQRCQGCRRVRCVRPLVGAAGSPVLAGCV